MAKVFITGSSDGLGLMVGRLLAEQGHAVVLHARSEERAEDARVALPRAEAVLVGDLSTLAAMRDLADQANGQGRFNAVVHNVGIGYREPRRTEPGRPPMVGAALDRQPGLRREQAARRAARLRRRAALAGRAGERGQPRVGADPHPAAGDPELQDRLLDYCHKLSGIALE